MAVKKLLRPVLGRLCCTPLPAQFVQRFCRGGRGIVFAHYFGEDREYLFPQARTSLTDFRSALVRLGRQFEFASLDDVLLNEVLDPGGKPRLALTFDDGFDLIREGAVGVLEELGIPATFFVITQCLDNRSLMWRNRLMAIQRSRGEQILSDALAETCRSHGIDCPPGSPMAISRAWKYGDKEELTSEIWKRCEMEPIDSYLARHQPYFTLSDLHRLVKAGHSIGLHTASHPFCDTLTGAETEQEFDQPLEWLRGEFGYSKVAVSYPFGVRLSVAEEERIWHTGKASCLLGIRGLSPRGVPDHSLERASIETDHCFGVYAGTLKNWLFQRGRVGSN